MGLKLNHIIQRCPWTISKPVHWCMYIPPSQKWEHYIYGMHLLSLYIFYDVGSYVFNWSSRVTITERIYLCCMLLSSSNPEYHIDLSYCCQMFQWLWVSGGCTVIFCQLLYAYHRYSTDPFHIYTSYHATSEGVLRVKLFSKFKDFFWQILWIRNFDFYLFWLGIQYELVNNMGNHGSAGGILRMLVLLDRFAYIINTLFRLPANNSSTVFLADVFIHQSHFTHILEMIVYNPFCSGLSCVNQLVWYMYFEQC